jgi:GTPase SAR1 family protein
MARNLFFIGTAGCGKSTMVHAFREWLATQGLDAIAVNLDPGAERILYDPEVDVRDWIKLSEVMEEHGLGPNGAQVVAADLLAMNAGEIVEVMEGFKTNYFLIDTPGQVELFTFRESSKVVIDAFGREDSILIYLNDPALVKTPSGLISSVLLSATAQFRHSLPFVSVLSKADLLGEEEVEKIVNWSLDPIALYDALMEDGTTPKTLLDVEFMKEMETIGVYRRLFPVSSEAVSGFEDVYNQVQLVFEGGEDLRPD